MKTRTSLPLLYALSFLMLFAASGSAQIILTPWIVGISLDSALITFDLNQTSLPQDTIRGSITNYSPDLHDYLSLIVSTKYAMQWIISPKIDTGNGFTPMRDGDTIGIAPGQTLSIEVIIAPYAERPDTESYCLSFRYKGEVLAEQCIPLAVTNAKSAVSTDLPAPNITLVPNPAASSIFVRGLDDMQAGYRYEIFSVSGAEVLQGVLPADAHINVQNLSSGAYRLLLSDAQRLLITTGFTVLH